MSDKNGYREPMTLDELYDSKNFNYKSQFIAIEQYDDLRAKYEKAMVCIEWFANERLYEMDSFMTASPIHQVGEMPTNIRIEGNPILKLGLKKAQECIEELGEK